MRSCPRGRDGGGGRGVDTPTKGWRSSRPRTEDYAARVRRANNVERLRIVASSIEWRAKVAYHRATVGVLPRQLTSQFEVYRALHERMLRKYEPTGTYNGPVLLIRGDDHTVEDGDVGWSTLITGLITVAQVTGRHERLLREPWVGPVARAMNEAVTATCV